MSYGSIKTIKKLFHFLLFELKYGGPEGSRTPDLINANDTL